METKAIIIWGQGDFDKVSPKLNSYLFPFFFQDSEEGGTQASDTTKMVHVGWRYGKQENCLGELGDSMSIKGKRRLGNQRFDFNQALLGKWKWDLFHHQGELWARVLDSKYGGWRNLDGNNTSQPAFKWSDLSEVCHNSGEESWFKPGIRWNVGSGSKARFWEDEWMANGISLKVKYPRLYLNSNQ